MSSSSSAAASASAAAAAAAAAAAGLLGASAGAAYHYVVTAQASGAISLAVCGAFTGPLARDVIVAKGNKLEVLEAEAAAPAAASAASAADAPGVGGLRALFDIPVNGRIPDPAEQSDPERRRVMSAALEYMGLKPGDAIAGTPIDWVFIGSCTNSRLPDLRSAAAIARGRKVAKGVRAWVVPGSQGVKRDAEAEGLDRVFLEAGFEWREPGCSLCVGANGEQLARGERSVSTSNRNFVGRQGPGARTHLASPAMAAAAAITGTITDVRKLAP